MANDLVAGINAGTNIAALWSQAAQFRDRQKLDREELEQRRLQAAAQIAAQRQFHEEQLGWNRENAGRQHEEWLVGLKPEEIALYNQRIAQQAAQSAMQQQPAPQPSGAKITIDSRGLRYSGTAQDALQDSQHPVIGPLIGQAVQKTFAQPKDDESLPDWSTRGQGNVAAPTLADSGSAQAPSYGYNPNIEGTIPVPSETLERLRTERESANQKRMMDAAEVQARLTQANTGASSAQATQRKNRIDAFKTFVDMGYSPEQSQQMVNAYDPGALPGQLPVTQSVKASLTKEQSGDFGYAKRMVLAENVLNNIFQKYDPTTITAWVQGGDNFPEMAKSSEFKQFQQASRNWAAAVLRRESGAVISPSEYEQAALQYFPLVSDPPVVLAQKADARQAAFDGMVGNLPKSYQEELYGSLKKNAPAELVAPEVAQEPSTSVPTSEDPNRMTVGRRLAAGTADVAAGLGGVIPDTINSLVANPIRKAMGDRQFPSVTEAIRSGIDTATGGYTREGEDAHSYGAANRLLAGFLATGGAAGIASKAAKLPLAASAVADAMKISTGADLASAVGAALGVGAAKEMAPDSAAAEMAGAVIGGIGPGLARAATRGSGALVRTAKAIVAGKTPEEVAADLLRAEPDAAGRLATSDRLALVDTSKEAQALGRTVRKMGGQGEKEITNFLDNRAATETKRIADLVHKEISGKEYFSNLDELQTAYRAAADPLYQEAFNEPFRPSEAMGKMIASSPTLKSAFKKATADVADAGFRPTASFEKGVDTRTADYMKEFLDNQINKAVKLEDNRGVFELTKLKNRFLDVVDRVNPFYSEARGVAADYNQIVEAQKFGMNFNRYKPEAIRKTLDSYSSSQREAALIGLREAIETAAGRSTDQTSATAKFYGQILNKERIAEFFGNEESFSRFDRALRDELLTTKTRNTVLGGSNTDYNLARGAEKAIDLTKGGVASNVINWVTDAWKSKASGINKKNASEIAKILTQREKALEVIQKLDIPAQQRVPFIESIRAQSAQALRNAGVAGALSQDDQSDRSTR